jgi:hypothetical protein
LLFCWSSALAAEIIDPTLAVHGRWPAEAVSAAKSFVYQGYSSQLLPIPLRIYPCRLLAEVQKDRYTRETRAGVLADK